MSDLFLYDDATARRFEPFALTRPMSEMRAGAMMTRERWSHALARAVAGSVTSAHLETFEEPGAANVASGGETLAAGSILANARFCPALVLWSDGKAWRNEGRVVALRLPRSIEVAELQDGRVSLDDLVPDKEKIAEVPGLWIEQVWDYIGRLPHMLFGDVEILSRAMTPTNAGAMSGGSAHKVFVEDGVTIEPHVYFDVTAGSIILRRGATVQAFTRLVGPCVVGEESVVGVDKITGCSIGDHCKIHGELSVTIVLGHSNKSHDGFVGHSYLGRWVNLGAGTITSNLKNTYGTVQMWTPDEARDTKLQFLGTLFGDHVKTGIGTTLNTGTVIGAGANVWGTGLPPKVIPPFAWGDHLPYSTYELRKFLDVARRVMSRRHVELSLEMETALARAFERRWSVMSVEKEKK